jgi:hypothetical protein
MNNELPVSIKYEIRFEKSDTIILKEDSYKLGAITALSTHVDILGHIFIRDNKNKLFVEYDNTGRFERVIGKKGHGPGEYTHPVYLETDSLNNRYVFDGARFVLIKYNDKNKYTKEYSFSTGVASPGEFKIFKNIKIISLFSYKGNSRYDDVGLFHLLNEKFEINRSINISYPKIYDLYDLYNSSLPSWDLSESFVYCSFSALPEITKYDFFGNIKQVYKVNANNFKTIDRKFTSSNQSIVNKVRYYSEFSSSYSLNIFNKKDGEYIFFTYYNTAVPDQEMINIFDMRPFRKFYGAVIDVSGSQIPLAQGPALPGEPLFCTKDGILYLLLNDKPTERSIGVYKIIITETKD